MPTVHTFTEVGGHLHNEDFFLVQPHPDDPDCWFCLLADGMGGQPGGARAACLACEVAMNRALGLPATLFDNPMIWGELLEEADAVVAADAEAGFTTLVGFSVVGTTIFGASCGDSAVVLVDHDVPPTSLTRHQFKNPPVGSGEAAVVRQSMNADAGERAAHEVRGPVGGAVVD